LSSLGCCPSCKSCNFKKHATYFKYYYNEQIQILRVRCLGCKRTHALIPSFSLPGTSLGTAETETYLINRDHGKSRSKSFPVDHVFTEPNETGKRIDKMFITGIHRAKALLQSVKSSNLTGISWINFICGQTETPLLTLNQYCLTAGFNPVCFNRFNILVFTKNKSKRLFSLNNPSTPKNTPVLDST